MDLNYSPLFVDLALMGMIFKKKLTPWLISVNGNWKGFLLKDFSRQSNPPENTPFNYFPLPSPSVIIGTNCLLYQVPPIGWLSNASINRELSTLNRIFALSWPTKIPIKPHTPTLKEDSPRKGFFLIRWPLEALWAVQNSNYRKWLSCIYNDLKCLKMTMGYWHRMGKSGKRSSSYLKIKESLCNQRVGGSNPSVGSMESKRATPSGSPFLWSNEQTFNLSTMKVWTSDLPFYPVRNNAPLLPPGQAPPRKGSCPGGRPSGPAAAAGLPI